jgi:hypothetical protein
MLNVKDLPFILPFALANGQECQGVATLVALERYNEAKALLFLAFYPSAKADGKENLF